MNIKIYSSGESEIQNWYRYYEQLPAKGIYHYPGYIKFLEKNYYDDSCAELFICEDEKEKQFIYYPYFKRSLRSISLKLDEPELAGHYDIISSWYFGGPLPSSKNIKKSILDDFFNYFAEHCSNANIITSFSRMDPNLENHKLLISCNQNCTINREGVYIDLTKSKDTIWSEINSSCKRNIKKSFRSGLAIRELKGLEDINAFWDIYNSEMIRKKSRGRLRFSHEFFDRLFSELSNMMSLLLATKEDKVVGGFVIAHDDAIAHHFLSASLPEFWDLRVNDLLFYSSIIHSKNMGCKIFDFQGGREGVFQFKSKFSPLRNKLYLSTVVYDEKTYNYLEGICIKKGMDMSANYFPLYRYLENIE